MISDFANAYSVLMGLHVAEIRQRESPDFELTIYETGELLGVEITGLHQDSREAKINYNKLHEWGAFTGDFGKLAGALQARLDAKARLSFKYQFSGPMFLAVWVGSIVFSHADDARRLARDVLMPPSRFHRVFLVHKGSPPGDSALTEIVVNPAG